MGFLSGLGRAALIFLASATAATAGQAPPDAIYFNGKVVTVDDRTPAAEAFAVKGDRFVAVGTRAQVLALAGPATRRVDLGGATVVPGLSDNHDHLWNASRYLTRGVDLVGVTSVTEIQNRLRPAVARARAGEVVFTTTGWAVQPALTRKDLDQVSSEIPIVVVGNRRGVAVLNSAALARLGVSKTDPTFMGARLRVDEAGEPIGATPSYPQGLYMVERLAPPLTDAEQDRMVREAVAHRHALGITSVRDLALMPEDAAKLQRMRREGKLKLRISVCLEVVAEDPTARLATLPAPTRGDLWLQIDCAGEEPWTPGVIPVERFTEFARAANRLGWRLAPHVNADAVRGGTADEATVATLAAYEAADRDSSLKGKRWFVEHVPFATPDQMRRMQALGLIVSTQDAGYRPVATAPLPPERMAHQNPVRELGSQGLVVIGGSDTNGPSPVEAEPNNPMIPFHFYVTRKTTRGDAPTVGEAVSREQALKAFTSNAAYAAFAEDQRGRIAPGLLADFVILNRDLMTVPDDRILATRPLATFIGGERVYAAPGSRF